MQFACAVVLGLGVLVAPAPGEEGASRVAYRHERLSVTASACPLENLLADIGRATGATIVGSPAAPRAVSVHFEDLALTEGLQRVLGDGENFTIRYGEDGRVATIALKGRPEEARVPPPPPPVTGGVERPVPSLPRRFLRHRPLPVPEELAQVVGGDTATFEQLFDAALTAGNGVVRLQAMMVTLSALERERGLRRTLSRSLRGRDDSGLGPFLQSRGAFEMLEFFAAHSREPGLQKKAAVLLQQLRTPAGAPAGG